MPVLKKRTFEPCGFGRLRECGTWADWLCVPRHTCSAVFGAVIARGVDYRQVFQHFRPGFDQTQARRSRKRPQIRCQHPSDQPYAHGRSNQDRSGYVRAIPRLPVRCHVTHAARLAWTLLGNGQAQVAFGTSDFGNCV
jgi:hypothetical protein